MSGGSLASSATSTGQQCENPQRKNNTFLVKMEKACRTCLKLLRLDVVPYYEVEDADVQLSPNSNRYKILSVFPEMALNISTKSVICSACHEILETFYQFKMRCLRTESMIMRYIHSKPDLEIETIDLKDVALVNNTGYVANAKPNPSQSVKSSEKRSSSHFKENVRDNSNENTVTREINGFIGDGVVIERVSRSKPAEEPKKAGTSAINNGVTIEKVSKSKTCAIIEKPNHSNEVSSQELMEHVIVKEEIVTEDEYNEEAFFNNTIDIDESITVVKHELVNEDEQEMVIPPENTVLNVTQKLNEMNEIGKRITEVNSTCNLNESKVINKNASCEGKNNLHVSQTIDKSRVINKNETCVSKINASQSIDESKNELCVSKLITSQTMVKYDLRKRKAKNENPLSKKKAVKKVVKTKGDSDDDDFFDNEPLSECDYSIIKNPLCLKSENALKQNGDEKNSLKTNIISEVSLTKKNHSELSIIPMSKQNCKPKEEYATAKEIVKKIKASTPITEIEAVVRRSRRTTVKNTEAVAAKQTMPIANGEKVVRSVKIESEEPGVDNISEIRAINDVNIGDEPKMTVRKCESETNGDAKTISFEKVLLEENKANEKLVDVKVSEDLKDLEKVETDEYEVTSKELATVANSDDNEEDLKVDDDCSKLDDSGMQSGGSDDSLKNEEQSFQCTVCSKYFVTKSRLKTHTLCHTDERPYKCTVCPKGFNDKSTLKKHLKIHSGIKEYECELCQRQFYCKGNLNKHMSTHSGERPYKCTTCNRDFSRNEHLKQHRLIHTGDKNFECDICSKRFARRDSLIIHMMVHTGVRNYICEYCDKRCIDSSTLKKHLRSHTGDKPYECDVCQRRFTQKTHLTIHRRKHTGERPYNCTLCPKSFYSSNYLKIHKRTHTKEQPYECDVCKKRFSTVSNLKMHTKIHTGVRDFECGICNKNFIHKHDLRKHMMVHTQEKPFACHVCGKAFNKKTRAKQHIIKMHKDVDISSVVIEHNNTYVKEPLKVEQAVNDIGRKD